MKGPLIIIGASGRAAADSAKRAGYGPITVYDLFADTDLAKWAQTHQIPSSAYPNDLINVAQQLQHQKKIGIPWIFTGGLENYPEILDAWHEVGPCLGTSPASLQRCLDIHDWPIAAQKAGFRVPNITPVEDPGNPHATLKKIIQNLPPHLFILKSSHSTGGIGVGLEYRNLDFAEYQSTKKHHTLYWQRFLTGRNLAAVYARVQSQTTLLGITSQDRLAERHGRPFVGYRGSIGPVRLPDVKWTTLENAGKQLADDLDLVGPFGLDVIETHDTYFLVDINPRYPASAEVLEMSTGGSVFDAPNKKWNRQDQPRQYGKRIFYAEQPGWWRPTMDQLASLDRQTKIADVPPPDRYHQPGDPVLTLLLKGSRPSQDWPVDLSIGRRLVNEHLRALEIFTADLQVENDSSTHSREDG